MNEQNIIPHQIKTAERAREMGRKGGQVKSEKKQWAARLRGLKRKGLNDENYRQLVAMITEKKSFALDILMYLQGIKKDCNNVSQKTNIGRALTDLMKATHDKSTQINLAENQINIQSDGENKKITMKDLVAEMARRHREEIEKKENIKIIDSEE